MRVNHKKIPRLDIFGGVKQQREVAENLEARTEGIFLASYLKPRKKKCIGLFRVVQKIQTRP
jgi:hypothetical protein